MMRTASVKSSLKKAGLRTPKFELENCGRTMNLCSETWKTNGVEEIDVLTLKACRENQIN